jgi:hypothetical protein
MTTPADSLSRGRGRVALLALVAAALAPSPRVEAAGALTGSVRDLVGRGLAGVEVLIVDPHRAVDPVAVARSGSDGRFRVPSPVPGVYTVAALKEGYETFVGRVDTLLETTIEVVLRPAERVEPASIARDPSWALRLPERGILRAVGPEPVFGDGSDGGGADAADTAMRVEVDQLFSATGGTGRSDATTPELSPTETRLTVASALGDRASLRAQGRSERLHASGFRGEQDTAALETGAYAAVELGYEAPADSRLAATAFYDHRDYELATGGGAPTVPLEERHRTWGYGARWSRQVDAGTRVGVQVDYRDTSAGPLRGQAVPPTARGASSRSVRAQGSCDAAGREHHRVELAVHADQHRASDDAVAPGEDARWRLQAEARDTWSAGGELALIYGLAYAQAVTSADSTLLVPRVGGIWSAGRWIASTLVSYHLPSGEGSAQGGAGRSASPVGYEAGVGMGVVDGVQLQGSVASAPVRVETFGPVASPARTASSPLFLSDGNVAVREYRVAVTERRGTSGTWLELSSGRAEGDVAPLLSFESTAGLGAAGLLRYAGGRLGWRLPERGADLAVEYRRVRAEGTADGTRESSRESVELQFGKTLAGLRVPGDWRLLLALRLGSVESMELADPEASETVDALNRRVGAGVSVVF